MYVGPLGYNSSSKLINMWVYTDYVRAIYFEPLLLFDPYVIKV